MKGFAKVMMVVGILSVVAGLLFVVVESITNDWSSLMNYVTYILLEDSERALWQVGVLIALLGYWLLSRQKRKQRIFY
ncbi:hypothetical protein [Alkalibacillus salilacus]|uniref:LPXTG cell wall anchor domain-containing protein n=1 Tax=Alkalibacillus salilacus TaxID=284582 RepID=A0ABT9VER8_9BACI|nr:hypothetical protein [Alkalibacillus salilacus]MDQ0159350.1 hypothetical protein [Alkalibacillus salilacus]